MPRVTVHLAVHDLPRSVRFYRRLGFQTARHDGGAQEAAEARLALGGTVLQLDEIPQANGSAPWARGLLGQGVRLRIDVPDLDAAWSLALDAELPVREAPTQTAQDRSFALDDPDGYVVVFSEPSDGSS